MARKQTTPRRMGSEDQTQEASESIAPDSKSATISKAEAIRAARRAGIESPTAASNYIQNRFGIYVSRAHFSAFKSQAKKAQALGRASKPGLEAIGEGDLLEALESIKPLVASLGADRVKRIVDLLE
jgi:hypothetical protein